MRIVDRVAIRAREPHVEGYQAIEVPSTGIVASEELVKAYARVATGQGANIVNHAKVERLEPLPDGIRVISTAGEIETRCLVNSAGLFSDEIAAMLGSKMAEHRIYPVRGEYCELVRSKQNWINGLVYPMPHADGLSLGTHLTKTLGGNVLLARLPGTLMTRTTTNAIAYLSKISRAARNNYCPRLSLRTWFLPTPGSEPSWCLLRALGPPAQKRASLTSSSSPTRNSLVLFNSLASSRPA